ncbi:multiple sugar transport system substrate-binding protein [Nakamurella sp. UYEF19]|uniref:ABC transporter substrate-binding protein n=1 Tax=Nakamurella sp. UYEF19 TaxID=1756392 RepID=UPI00339B41FC
MKRDPSFTSTAAGVAGNAFNRRQMLRVLGAAATLPLLSGLAACSGTSTAAGPVATTSSGAAATGGAAGATAVGGATTSSTASGSLSFVYYGDANQQAQFKSLFAEFNKINPAITLQAQGIASASWATFSNTVATRIAGGQIPDIIQIATEGQRIFASKGLLEPLDPYIARDKALVDNYYADIDPNLKAWTTKYGSTDGKTYYMPGGYNTVCMYLNTEILAKAGATVPTGDWSWDDFKAAAQQVKDKTGAFMLPVGSGYFTDVMPWLTTNGAATFNADWNVPTFNTAAAVEAVTFAKSLIDAGLAPKPGGAFDAATNMSNGKLAGLAGGRWPTIDMRRLKIVDKVQIVKWPKKIADGSPVGWDAWPITKASKNKDAAWEFIKFLISKPAGDYFATIGGTIVPARLSVAKSASFTTNAPKGSGLLSDAIAYATPIPSPDRGAEIQKTIEDAWLKVISGNGDAQSTLEAANTKLKTLL